MLRIRLVIWAVLFSIFSACSFHTAHVQLLTQRQVNWDSHHQPLPVVIRIYQLRDNHAFNRANFRDLWHNDSAVLRPSLVQRDELTLSPNSNVQFKLALRSETRFIAGVALFREPKRNRWRVIQPITQDLSHLFKTMTWIIQGYEIYIKS